MSEKKLYKYKNTEYELAPVTLGVLASAAPMLAQYRKLVSRYTGDIDISKAEKAKAYVEELITAIEQLKAIESESTDEREKESVSLRINELDEKLAKAQSAYDLDSSIQSSLKLFNECRALAMLELFGKEEIVSRFISAAMVPSNASGRNTEIDYSDPKAVEFVKDAVSDFFVCIAGSLRKSGG